jgi:N-methylhydantoinase B
VSSIADRTKYAAPGLLGGQAGAAGEVALGDGTQLHAKSLVDLGTGDTVHVNLPGGGGYGEPLQRDIQRVLWDVIEGYITPEEAEKNYGVAVRYVGKPEELVKLPDQWVIDESRTAELRRVAKA